jgi:hypothetical protein
LFINRPFSCADELGRKVGPHYRNPHVCLPDSVYKSLLVTLSLPISFR